MDELFFGGTFGAIIRFAQFLREGITNPLSRSPHADLQLGFKSPILH